LEIAMQKIPQPKTTPAQPMLTPAEKHEEDALDEALKETFPSSDPIAVSVPASAERSN